MEDGKEDAEPHPEWNTALETVIKKEGEQAEGLYWLHNQAAVWAQKRNDRITIPAIILATLTGFFSATNDMIPPLAIGGASVLVGILNTVNSYFKFSQRAEGHRITSLWYLKTYKNIETQLSLPISQRQNAGDLLKDLRESMIRVSETAPPLPEAIKATFKEKFKDSGTHKPIEANGLDRIEIFKAAAAPPVTPKVMETPKSPIKVTVMV